MEKHSDLRMRGEGAAAGSAVFISTSKPMLLQFLSAWPPWTLPRTENPQRRSTTKSHLRQRTLANPDREIERQSGSSEDELKRPRRKDSRVRGYIEVSWNRDLVLRPGIQPKGHWTISCNSECSFFPQIFWQSVFVA